MSIRKGTQIIAGNLGQNIDNTISLTSNNPVKNSVIARELQNKISTNSITNCITKIPQDIKLEINSDKELILKSGSKFYYPNGLSGTTPVFGSYTTTQDITLGVGGADHENKPHFIVLSNNGSSHYAFANEHTFSGTTTPTSQYALWYDTGNNIIRATTNGGTTWTSTPYSFPICIATNTAGKCENIEQIFNGFGYLADSIFALPGTKGLIPDGRNEDGTLKNIEWENKHVTVRNDFSISPTTSSLKHKTYIVAYDPNSTDPKYLFGHIAQAAYKYDSVQNRVYELKEDSTINKEWPRTLIGYQTTEGITIKLNQTFQALDSNRTDYIAHQGFPSSKYVDLTLGASGSEYVAPADGWFTVAKKSSTDGQYINFVNTTTEMTVGVHATGNSFTARLTIPVSKGNKIICGYNLDGVTDIFRFIYANGSI